MTIILAMITGALIATFAPWISAILYLNPWLALVILAAIWIWPISRKEHTS